jgi:diguanylate cyclase (GGDEF)-like protein/PAS domain S-box-containing protein
VSLAVGMVAYTQNPKRPLNRVFGLACLFVSVWAFSEFMYRQTGSLSTAGFWIKVRALVWTYPLAFLLHFLLIYTKKTKWLRTKTAPFLIYGPAVLFSVVDVGTFSITGRPILMPWGYTYAIPETWINWVCNSWTALLGVLALVLALRHYFRAPDRRKKTEAKFVVLGISFPILGGIASEIVLPEFGIRIPELTSVSMTWLALCIGYAVRKHELFAVNPAMAAENILATMNEMFFLLNPEGKVLRTNRKSREILGYEENDLVGKPIGVLMSDEFAHRGLIEKVRESGSIESVEICLRTKLGRQIPALFSGSMIKDHSGLILGIIGISRDISDRKRIEEELRALSLVDELTGLYNRRGFMTLAKHQQKIAARAGQDMLLLYADVDDFKNINDTYGHGAGDAALAQTAKIFKESFRSSDITARLGGDEFAVLALETSAPCSDLLKARLEGKLLAKLAEADFPFELSLSIGMVCFDPKVPCSIEDLLAEADRAMYARKQARKAR